MGSSTVVEEPELSVVVVAHAMARELPRTLHTLSPAFQVGVAADAYEVVVVDNGSPEPIDARLLDRFGGRIRLERLDPAPPSPARAANHGLSVSKGDLVGLVVDGARMVSPGLLAGALRARRMEPDPVVTAPAYHLGSVPHMRAAEVGYDQGVEDGLLDRSGWLEDGYRLFGVCTFAGSSSRGWFGPMGESSSLFMRRRRWDDLGGLDESFDLPGGGLVNHDLYRRACELPGVVLVQLVGEGTFHQFHGGAATGRRYTWEEMHDQYRSLRGEAYVPPPNRPVHLGALPDACLPVVARSAELAIRRLGMDVPSPG